MEEPEHGKAEKSVSFEGAEKRDKAVSFAVDDSDDEEEEEVEEVHNDDDDSEEELNGEDEPEEDEEEPIERAEAGGDENGQKKVKKIQVIQRRGNFQGPLCIIKPVRKRKLKTPLKIKLAPKRKLAKGEEFWSCPECTYENNPEDFKCEMCFASKVTSTGRKAKRNPSSVEEMVATASLDEAEEKKSAASMTYFRPHFMSEDVVAVKTSPPPPDKPNAAKANKWMKYDKLFDCDQCDYQATQRSSLKRHRLTIHEGVRFTCDKCDYSAGQQSILKQHIKTEHEGLRYDCDQCDYQATQLSSLKRHKMSQHEGIKKPNLNRLYGVTYDCDSCDYKAGQLGSLKRHKLAKHEGVKFECDQCDHQASTPGNLRLHKKCKHEGVRYPCDMCSYEATQSGSLSRHKQTKHNVF